MVGIPLWNKQIKLKDSKINFKTQKRTINMVIYYYHCYFHFYRHCHYHYNHWSFTRRRSGIIEHTVHLAYLVRQAKRNQRFIAVILLDIRNAFAEVHQSLIHIVLAYYDIPDNIIKALMSIYEDFALRIAIDSFTTPFFHIKKGVLQGDCLSP